MKAVIFRELVKREYFDKGVTKEVVLSKLVYESGLCGQSVRAALKGSRVNSDAAKMLGLWVAKVHHVELDELDLVRAPPKTKPARERGDPGKRAEELIEAAMQDAALPAELACVVAFDCGSGLWRAICRDRSGGPVNEQSAPELSEALRAVRDEHYGRRSA